MSIWEHTTRSRASFGRRLVRGAVLGCAVLGSALLGTACGGGGGASSFGVPGAGSSGPASTIDALTLPAMHVGTTLEPFQLTVGKTAPALVRWTLDAGVLPPGLSLSASGLLTGTPASAGVYAFEVRAILSAEARVLGLAAAVDAFGIYVRDGRIAGDAIEGRALTLASVGGEGMVQFDAVGPGAFASRAAVAGSAVFLPGPPLTAPETELRFQATDAEGRVASLTLPLRTDVAAGFRAEWGTTDVWYLDLDVHLGGHAYRSDFHAALAAIGLRDPDSRDAAGGPADRLAARCVRVALYRRISRYFRRSDDGMPGSAGLRVSLAYQEPGAGYLKPAVGAYMGGGPRRFSVMAFCDGTRAGVVGTAYVDDASNPRHENDTTSAAAGEFGVFLTAVTPHFNAAWSNVTLPEVPVGSGDLEALHAILHAEPVTGTRALEIERVVRGYAHALASVAAHEIGHSLGLEHTLPSVSGSLMNAFASLGPFADPDFLPGRIQTLRAILPGPGRNDTVYSAFAKPTPPGGGVSVCSGGCCNLCLPPAGVSPVAASHASRGARTTRRR